MHDPQVRDDTIDKVTPDNLAQSGAANANERSPLRGHFPRSIPSLAANAGRNWREPDNRLDDGTPLLRLPGFDALATRIHFRKKESLIRQSEPDLFVHFVMDGVVCLHRTFADGRRYVFGFALPGDFIGLWNEQAAAEALGRVSALRMTHVAFAGFLETSPDLQTRVQSHARRELAFAHDRMSLLAKFSAREKLASFLLFMRQRWQRVNGRSIYVPLPMTREDIGDCLGMTVETVSRMIGAFSRERLLLVVPEGVRLLDVPKLKAISQSNARATAPSIGHSPLYPRARLPSAESPAFAL